MIIKTFKTALFIFIIFLNIFSSVSQEPSWKLLPGSPTAGRFDDIFFINDKTGWTASNTVYRTTDGGLSWSIISTNPMHARSIAFFDSLNGVIGSLDSNNTLYKTTNGGFNWTKVLNIPQPVPKGICGLSIVNDSVIYGCGKFSGFATVIKSLNKGVTWESYDLTGQAFNLVDCRFFSADSGFVTGGVGPQFNNTKAIILFTSNGGLTWVQKALSANISNFCWKISFVSRKTGYVSIDKNGPGKQTFFKTTDYGETWQELIYPGGQQGIGFVNDSTGWLGFNIMRVTSDGGATWSSANFGITFPYINRIRFYGDTLGYASGSRIFKFTRDSIIGITNSQTIIPDSYNLHQNYPNPFNPSTVIKYEIFESSMTTLTIYNALGNVVNIFVNGYRTPGIREYVWDGTDLNGKLMPSGVYFYTLETEKYKESKKMILVR